MVRSMDSIHFVINLCHILGVYLYYDINMCVKAAILDK